MVGLVVALCDARVLRVAEILSGKVLLHTSIMASANGDTDMAKIS